MKRLLSMRSKLTVEPEQQEPAIEEVTGTTKRRYQGQHRDMLKNVPHEKKLCTIPEEERTCNTCGSILSPVGEEFVRSEIEYTPAKIKLLEENCLHADETPVQVLNEPGRKNTTQSYMWLYRTGKQSSKPVILFEYQPGRSGKYPESFLKGFQGYLRTDAYSGYGKVMSVKRCYCWTHLRRKFVEAFQKI